MCLPSKEPAHNNKSCNFVQIFSSFTQRRHFPNDTFCENPFSMNTFSPRSYSINSRGMKASTTSSWSCYIAAEIYWRTWLEQINWETALGLWTWTGTLRTNLRFQLFQVFGKFGLHFPFRFCATSARFEARFSSSYWRSWVLCRCDRQLTFESVSTQSAKFKT